MILADDVFSFGETNTRSELRLADVDVCRESLPVDARHVERHTFETVGSEGGGLFFPACVS